MNRKVATKFNTLIILTVVVSVVISSAVVTAYLLHQYTTDVIEMDRLHNKGLANAVGGFLDLAFSLDYQLSINPDVIHCITHAPADWQEHSSTRNSRR